MNKYVFLIIGNPSWIKKSELSQINSKNTISGKNNSDISESIILKMIKEFKDTKSTIAFICKNIVSRNIFIELIRNNIPYSFIKQININSSKIFKINTETCLFIIQFGGKTLTDKICGVSDISNPSKTLYKFGFISNRFYLNVDNIHLIDGECQIEWKQGVKHDCSKIMELTCENNQLKNGNNENVNIEKSLLYPLLKSNHLRKPIINETSKYIIITQKKIKEDTSYIKTEAPKTWKYLNEHIEHFDKRKSSIYKNAPKFSIFSIGDYSFNKYKVAISGFYKEPIFSLAYCEKTFMLDDSCYFLTFDDYDSAYITMLILNSTLVKKFLKNIAFPDFKRPFSKSILKRIDIKRCLDILLFEDLKEIERKLELDDYITQYKFIKYVNKYK